ncbi:MAG: hypothetical protein BHW42_04140 [Oscillibacter sp. CAG:241_62_21]|nr:MAG: hypothetical protein BHW42_04140 [Oscillibacter sp. CAG:241_62_21]
MPKILIIEDDPDIAAIERDYLELSGYEAVICADGTAGLNAALTESYDLLLLGLMLGSAYAIVNGPASLSTPPAAYEPDLLPVACVPAGHRPSAGPGAAEAGMGPSGGAPGRYSKLTQKERGSCAPAFFCLVLRYPAPASSC